MPALAAIFQWKSLDQLVLTQLAAKVFAKDRLNAMMVALRKRIKESSTSRQSRVNELVKQLKQIEERRNRLMDAVESGIFDLDETVQRRAQHLKASREALIVEVAVARRELSLPVDQIKTSQVELFGQSLRQRLMSNDRGFAKSYLNLLVSEIMINGKEATIKGSYGALAYAASVGNKKVGHSLQVPTSLSVWCARRDSNS